MKMIMVVDDNEDVRRTIKFVLDRQQDYKTILASNGDDCLEKLENLTKKPDLILLDIMMPGTPVAKIVEKIDDIKIAYLSAVWVSEAERKKMLSQKNVVDFIVKPFDEDELIKLIKTQVGE